MRAFPVWSFVVLRWGLSLCLLACGCDGVDPESYPATHDASVASDKATDSETASTDEGTSGDSEWWGDGPACPSGEERFVPLVISGQVLAPLAGHPVDAVAAYAFDGVWRRVPLQIDERVPVDAPNPVLFYVIADAADESFRVDDRAGLDDDDELVLPRGGFGRQAQDHHDLLPEGTKIEIEVVDPLGGPGGFVTLVGENAPTPLADDVVRYDRATCQDAPKRIGDECSSSWADSLEDTIVVSRCYEAHFEMNWVWDRLSVSPEAGGAGEDLLDRWKGRAFGPVNGAFGPPRAEQEDSRARMLETEGTDSWCQGWSSTDADHYYVGHKLGPLRAIRVVHGACSFKNLMRTMIFYEAAIEDRIWFRGHGVDRMLGGLGFYFDYRKEATPLRYQRKGLAEAVILDGVRDFDGNVNGDVVSAAEMNAGWWEQASGPLGSLGIAAQQIVPLPGGDAENTVGFYQLDDAGFKDGTGEQPGVYGGHGVRFRRLAPTVDEPAGFVLIYRPLEVDAPLVGPRLRALLDAPPVAHLSISRVGRR